LSNQKKPCKNILLLITEVIEMDSEYLRLPDDFVIFSKIIIFHGTIFFQLCKCFHRKQSFYVFYFCIFSNLLFGVHIILAWNFFSNIVKKVFSLFRSMRRMNTHFEFFLFSQSSFENVTAGTSYYRKS